MPIGVFEPSEKQIKSWSLIDLKLSKCIHEYFEVFAIKGGIVRTGSWLEEMPNTSARSIYYALIGNCVYLYSRRSGGCE